MDAPLSERPAVPGHQTGSQAGGHVPEQANGRADATLSAPPVTFPEGAVTVLARLHLRVERGGVTEPVVLERHWANEQLARRWCESVVGDPGPDVVAEDAQVLVEKWRYGKPWTGSDTRPVTTSVQVGVPDGSGGLRWSSSHPAVPRQRG